MHYLTTSFLFLLSAFLILPIGPVVAQQNSVVAVAQKLERNAEQRINFSGKLRMLSQRIPAAACHVSRGIDVEGASTLLKAAPIEFEKILTALEFGGDADLNIIHPETRRKTLMRIHALREQWEPLKAAAHKMSEGSATDEDIKFVFTQNMAVLDAAVQLVPELVKQYSNPTEVTYANLLLIDVSGRQRMLTQKMSKEACIMGTQDRTSDIAANLEKTVRIFEASLNALCLGLPELGLKAPPNSEISEGLRVVQSDWQTVKPILAKVLDDIPLDSEEDVLKFQRLNVTMANMNTVVGMYAQVAKTEAALPPS